MHGLERLWKGGVQLMDMVNRDGRQLSIFESPRSETEGSRQDRLMAALDTLNRNYGRGTVTVGMQ